MAEAPPQNPQKTPPIQKTIDPKLSMTSAEQALALDKAFNDKWGPLGDKPRESEPKPAVAGSLPAAPTEQDSGIEEHPPEEVSTGAEGGAEVGETGAEAPVQPEAAAEVIAAGHPDDEPDEEIDKFKLHPETKPESLSVFRDLRGMLKSERKKTFELEQRIKKEEAERGTPRPVNDPEVQKEIEDLRNFWVQHRIFDDTQYQLQYENPVHAQFNDIVNDIKGLSDDEQAATAWEQQVRGAGPDRLGKDYWNKGVIELISDPLDKDRVLRKVSSLMELQQKRNAFRKQMSEQPDAYVQFQHEQAARYWDDFGRQTEEEMKKVTPTLGEWATPKDLKLAKTTTEKAAMEAHNTAYNEYAEMFKQYLTDAATQGPRGMARISALAVQNEKRRRELEAVNKKIAKVQAERDKLQEELNKIAGARSRVSQPSSAGPNGQPAPQSKRKAGQSVDEAFKNFFGT